MLKGCLWVALAVVICGTVLVALFLILLSMPKSRLRSIFFEIFGWVASGGLVLLILSPIDFLPDPIFLDDIGYLIGAIAAGAAAYRQHRERREIES